MGGLLAGECGTPIWWLLRDAYGYPLPPGIYIPDIDMKVVILVISNSLPPD
jgi:hypothetical protein